MPPLHLKSGIPPPPTPGREQALFSVQVSPLFLQVLVFVLNFQYYFAKEFAVFT